MFTVDQSPEFTHTVDVTVPVDGGFESQSMDVTFQLLSDEETNAFHHQTIEGQKDFLDKVVKTISDLVDTDGKPLAFNDAVKAHIIGLPYARTALLKGYTDGVVPGRLGN